MRPFGLSSESPRAFIHVGVRPGEGFRLCMEGNMDSLLSGVITPWKPPE